MQLRFDILTPDMKLVMPMRAGKPEARLLLDDSDTAKDNSYLVLDGKTASAQVSSAALDGESGPFTVEAWVKPAAKSGGGIVSNMAAGVWKPPVRLAFESRQIRRQKTIKRAIAFLLPSQ